MLSQPDRPAGRGRKPTAPPVAVAARDARAGARAAGARRRCAAAAAGAPGAGGGRRRLRPARAAGAAARAAVRQPASLRAAALAGRCAHRASVDGRRAARGRCGDAARRGARRRARGRQERFAIGPDEDAGSVYERALELGLAPLARALADAGRAASRPCRRSASPRTRQAHGRRPRCSIRAGGARAARSRARAVAAHRRPAGPRGCCDTIWRTRVSLTGGPSRASSSGTRPLLLGCATGRSSCASCSRRAAPHARRRLAPRPARPLPAATSA